MIKYEQTVRFVIAWLSPLGESGAHAPKGVHFQKGRIVLISNGRSPVVWFYMFYVFTSSNTKRSCRNDCTFLQLLIFYWLYDSISSIPNAAILYSRP